MGGLLTVTPLPLVANASSEGTRQRGHRSATRVASAPMPFGLGIWEIVILVGVLALLFGAKGVPQVAKRLGTGVREIKDAVAEVDPRRMLEAGEDDEAKPAEKPTPKPPPASGDGPPTS